MNEIESVIIAVIEGITEYLPVSSTGHMIITERLLGVSPDNFTKLFTVAIQLGAIMSVLVLYWEKWITPFQSGKNGIHFYLKLLLAVVPALLLGKLFDDAIDALLENAFMVSISLFTGGVILLFIDKFFNESKVADHSQLSYLSAIKIGVWQCVAMIPGVSRSAASIIGGMQQKLTRNFAAEFSFFLAVPTMAAATGYSLILKDWDAGSGVVEKGYEMLLHNADYMKAFIIGNMVAFIVAMLAIKFFIGFLQKHGFKFFGWYRIAVGTILLFLYAIGYLH
ncbi:MAG: undecaprenyl-diphosphate phosphatase [Bacteroidota bacterium]